MGARVVVAMSGGVDSAVTAALLRQQGYEVSGLTFAIQPGPSEAVTQAQRIAARLGIPHEVLDLSARFSEAIILPFCRDYVCGRTPNPCVRCNRLIKFGAVLDYALAHGASYLATGHYARAVPGARGFELRKGMDAGKDQSYFLYTLGQAQLRHILFPLGACYKAEVRALAAKLGLAPLVRKESQDICFLPAGGYTDLVARTEAVAPGEIVDTQGRVLGRHKGLAGYTVGQRAGLGGGVRYVLKLEAATNRVVVGTKEELYRSSLCLGELSWVAGSPPREWQGVTARVRYRAPEVAVEAEIGHNTAEVYFAQPQGAIAPGQSVVFYHGDEVLGGGVIQESCHAAEEESAPQPEAHQP